MADIKIFQGRDANRVSPFFVFFTPLLRFRSLVSPVLSLLLLVCGSLMPVVHLG
jgi:hypothetical protein